MEYNKRGFGAAESLDLIGAENPTFKRLFSSCNTEAQATPHDLYVILMKE